MTSNRAMLKSTSSSENGAPGSPVDVSAVVFLPEKPGRKRKLTSWTTPRIFKIVFAALPVFLLLALVIVLVILLTRGNSNHPNKNGVCSFSDEAKRIGLDTFLRELQRKHHTLLPENIAYATDVTPDEIRQIYRPYDSSPSAIKNYTDEVRKLHDRLQEIIRKSIATKMKLRENKAMYVAQQLLKTSFDWGPYERNYYAGDWMFEPNMYCWQPICNVLAKINNAIIYFSPSDLKGLERIEDLLKKHNETISQYVENLKLGVATGMVRSTESCRAGIHAIKSTFHEIAVHKEKGIFNEMVAKTILSKNFTGKITEEMNNTWYKSRGEGVRASLTRFLLDYLGKPLVRLIRYLEEEHIRHCLSNDYASGLVKLPVSFVYVDDMIDHSKPTIGRLPTGEVINTSESYVNYFLYFFTSGGVTPEQLRDKGYKTLDILLSQARELAKQYTGIEDEIKAVTEFRKVLRSRDMFFNSEAFPVNESGEEAFLLCSDSTGARAFCPKRWETLQKWINSTKHVAKLLRPKLQPLFYFSNPKKTAPSCGVSVSGEYMPEVCFHGYKVIDFGCEESASQTLPFFMDDFGPKYTEYTTTSHEQLPGHHLEVQGFVENFEDKCGDAISWISSPNYLTAFTEGWATYVESPLMTRDTDAYANTLDKNILLQKYGMLKYQILAALRTVLDTGMNYFRMTRAQAMDLFDRYAWDDSDLATKDITRYQSSPGTVTSYLIGQETFVELRERTERELGSAFSLKEFHYQLLRQGELPLKYMETHISRFIACKKDSTGEGCQEILS